MLSAGDIAGLARLYPTAAARIPRVRMGALTSADGNLCLDHGAVELQMLPCTARASQQWRLDVNGYLHAVGRPGHCLGGANWQPGPASLEACVSLRASQRFAWQGAHLISLGNPRLALRVNENGQMRLEPLGRSRSFKFAWRP